MKDGALRIAMLSVHTCPLATLGGKKTGGMNVYVRELGAELGRRGMLVDIFTRSQDPCLPHRNSDALGPNVRVIHIPAGPEAPVSTLQIHEYLPEFSDNVRAFVAEQGLHYDLLHSHYWLSGLVALQLSEAWGIPVVQMFHTLGRMKNRIAQSDEEREPPLRIESERQIMEAADRLVAATPAERVQLMWLYSADMKKIQVIPPGVDIAHFRPIPRAEARKVVGISGDSKLLLFVGRIEPLKGIDTLLRAIAILKGSMQDEEQSLCLAIVGGARNGEGWEDREMLRLKTMGEQLGLETMVAFLGAKSQETLHYYYNSAEAVIMPSHYESFGMVALEAMASGTPVVASEVGGLAYLVQDGETGFHVPANEPEELAGRISLLLDNAALREEMSGAAVDYARDFSWARIAERVERLYLEVLGCQEPARVEHWDHPH